MARQPKASIRGEVVSFKRRKSPLTAARALALLREKEIVEVPSIATLAEMLGWERTRTSRNVQKWEDEHQITVERPESGGIIIRALPVDPVQLREFGPGENRDRPRRRKRASARSKASAEPRVRANKTHAAVRADERAFERENERAIPASAQRAIERAISPENRDPPITSEDKPTSGNTLNSTSSEAFPIPPESMPESAAKAVPDGARDRANTSTQNPNSGDHSMGLFSRSKNPPETPREPAVEPPVQAASATSYPAPKYNIPFPPPAEYDARLDWKPVRKGGGGGDDTLGFDAVDAFRRATLWERLLILIACSLSGTAAYISVNGMLTLYPAGGAVIVVMGSLMEALKFVGFGVVSAGWRTYGGMSRSFFSVLLLTAALVNAGGVYGWLISQHASPAAVRSAAFSARDADEGARIEVAQARLNDLDKRINLIDGAADGAGKRGKANTALNAIDSKKRDRAAIEAEREKTVKELADLRASRSGLAARHGEDEAAALPVKYAAALFEDVGLLQPGTDPEKLFRWISFFILLCGDPAALAAMFMVNSRSRQQGRKA